MNTEYRKRLPGTDLDYFDTRAAVDAIQPGAYDTLPYTSRILAEQLVRRCEPAVAGSRSPTSPDAAGSSTTRPPTR